MKKAVHIQGGDVDRQAVKAVAKATAAIFEAAYETHMDQETVRAALVLVSRLGTVNDLSISNCNFRGDR